MREARICVAPATGYLRKVKDMHDPGGMLATPSQRSATHARSGVVAIGFVPGITSSHDSLGGGGRQSGRDAARQSLQVPVLHNVVRLLFGIAGITMSRNVPSARGSR